MFARLSGHGGVIDNRRGHRPAHNSVAISIGAKANAPLLGPTWRCAGDLGDCPCSRSLRTNLAGIATAMVLAVVIGGLVHVDPVLHRSCVTHGVMLGEILKPDMGLPGLTSPQASRWTMIADATLTSLLRVVPAAVAGIAFLSGGQSGELASARLNAMHVRYRRDCRGR